MVNILVESCEAKHVVVFIVKKEQFNEGRTPCILIGAFPHVPPFSWKQLMKDPSTKIRDEELRHKDQR